MGRASRGAGWRRAARTTATPGRPTSIEFAEESALPRGRAAVDEELLQRLRTAVFADGGQLNRSVRISPAESGSGWVADYLSILHTLDAGDEVLAGWWSGIASNVVAAAGPPDFEIPVERGTDLDLVVWATCRKSLESMLAAGGAPTLLATWEPGWVLVSPPAGDELFLYPEASDTDRDRTH